MFKKLIQSSKMQIAIIIVLILLLPLLAIFQYHWLGQLSDAEEIRMQTNLQASAERFSEEFDRELTNIYSTFNELDLNAEDEKSKILFDTYNKWKHDANYPELIDSIFVLNITPKNETVLYGFDTTKVILNESTWPEKFTFLKPYFNNDIENILFRVFTLTHGPILRPSPMILVSQPSNIIFESIDENCTDNWLILITLKSEVLQNQIIQNLVKEYFYQDNTLNFELMISKEGDVSEQFYHSGDSQSINDFTNPDARTSIGSWRIRNMIIASAKYVSEESEVTKINKIVKDKSLSIQVFTGDSINSTENTKYLIAKVDRWELLVKHEEGSLEEMVRKNRNTNLAISYVILIILGIGIALALIYARRVALIGQQQMEFVANVTHELRTPLAVIHSAGENIVDGVVKTDAQFKKYGSLVRDESKRLSNMVEQVLEFAGIQSKKHVLKFEQVNLIELLKRIIQEYPKDSKITLNINCSETMVNADKNALKTAFINILDNSIKYSDKNSPIDISIKFNSDKKLLVVGVKDIGFGISTDEIGKIFEPFYRGKNATERTIPGSGLGLSLVKGIIENHGGTIYVQSELNQGSNFIINLPVGKNI